MGTGEPRRRSATRGERMWGRCRTRRPFLLRRRHLREFGRRFARVEASAPGGGGRRLHKGIAGVAAMQKSIAAISFIFPPLANRGPRPRCRHNRGGCGLRVMLRACALRSLEPAWRQRVSGSRTMRVMVGELLSLRPLECGQAARQAIERERSNKECLP